MEKKLQNTHVKYNVKDNIAFVTIDFPERNNILEDFIVSGLMEAFREAQRDANTKVVILQSTGSTFCIGIDNLYLEKILHYDFTQNLQESLSIVRLFEQIYTIRKPVIALVQGPALSNGCGLAMVCDIVVAAEENAEFGLEEVKLGLISAASLIFIAKKIGEGRAKEFIIRGERIKAKDALKIGLIDRLVPISKLEKTGIEIARNLIDCNSTKPVGLVKELFLRTQGMNTIDSLEFASNISALARMNEDFRNNARKILDGKN